MEEITARVGRPFKLNRREVLTETSLAPPLCHPKAYRTLANIYIPTAQLIMYEPV